MKSLKNLILAIAASSVAGLASAETWELKEPLNLLIANCEEPILIEGTTHFHLESVWSGDTFVHTHKSNFSNVKGYGQLSGKRYNVTGTYKGSWTASSSFADITGEYHNYIRVIPQGGGVIRKLRYAESYGIVNGQPYSNITISDVCE